MMQPTYFASPHLIYRATEDTDSTFFHTLDADTIGKAQADASPLQPTSTHSAKATIAWLKTCLLAVIICRPAPTAPVEIGSSDDDEKTNKMKKNETTTPTSIGHLALTGSDARDAIHRGTTIVVRLLPEYRGQGYGTEAIEWACDYAFGVLGLHRVGIGYYGWNEGAGRLYKRLGFREECRRREARWHLGRWWDVVDLGMLEGEWRGRNPSRFDEMEGLVLG